VQFAQFFFKSVVYICIAVGDAIIKSGRVVIPLTGLTSSQFCACLIPGPGFPSFVYICIAVGDAIIKRGVIPLTGLTPVNYVPVPNQDLDSQQHMLCIFLIFNDLR